MKIVLNVLLLILTLASTGTKSQTVIYVSLEGSDDNKGSLANPLRSVNAAIAKAMKFKDHQVAIEIRKGTYFIDTTIVIHAEDYQLTSLSIRPHKNEKVTISGAQRIRPNWTPYRDGIVQARVELATQPDRLWMGNTNLPLARYPNYVSTARVFNGTAADAISEARLTNWKNPSGGYLHALHRGEWGSFHYVLKGKDGNGKPILEGGWQNNRPAPIHDQHRFVENIFEELDAPGEWYYDKKAEILYLYALSQKQMQQGDFYVSKLDDLIVIKGTATQPVRNISISNIRFTGTNRTFMLTREPLLRSDWTIYRGGAILLDGTESISVNDCVFEQLGGNAVFVSNYNRDCNIKDNHINNIGASAIAFVGSATAVRSPAFRYEQFVPWGEMDYTPGPQSEMYPKNCAAIGNLIHNIGLIEKQVAGVQISMSADIRVANNTIYEVPRAGINIGDGCWGGHVIENNDVFNTVLETGDHGAFNSWGRDRFWRPEREITDSIIEHKKGIEFLDAMKPVTIRNNRFHCEHGWDIDLDDGSSNYHIYNNVCLNGGLKLREGYGRVVRNNVIINNTFHPHVWYKKSRDIFTNNIVSLSYAPIMMESWGSTIDSNLFLTSRGVDVARKIGADANSISGDAQFTAPLKNDFTVRATSPALTVGFVNFPMNFGVTEPTLQKLAKKAPVPPRIGIESSSAGSLTEWHGSSLKNIETLGERSAAGIHNDNGVLVADVQKGSLSAKSLLQPGDVITKVGDDVVTSVTDFIDVVQKIKWMGSIQAVVIRNQREQHLKLLLK